MKQNLILTAVLVSLFLFFDSAHSRGMHWMGSGGWGTGSNYSRVYDVKTVTSVTGEVASIDYFTPQKGMHKGVHLSLKTSDDVIDVHLGPNWFVENQDIKIVKGDKIEVKGSKVSFNGKPAMIAASVKKGDDVLTLRDDAGIPAWAGMRR